MGELWNVEKNAITSKAGSRSDWHQQLRKHQNRCKWCNVLVNATTKGLRRATVDHIHPTGLGGKNTRENTKVSCLWCNEGRATTGHCIVTLVCISMIVGPSISKIARYYNESRKLNP